MQDTFQGRRIFPKTVSQLVSFIFPLMLSCGTICTEIKSFGIYMTNLPLSSCRDRPKQSKSQSHSEIEAADVPGA